ncbi:6002_t:CDS:2, partial [Acaulospora colombiana]
SPLGNLAKTRQVVESPPISPPISPRSQAFATFPDIAAPSPIPANVTNTRPRLTSAIRIQAPKNITPQTNGAPQSAILPGHRPRTGSISSSTGLNNKPRVASINAKVLPQKIVSTPTIIADSGHFVQSPPKSTLSVRSSPSKVSSSLSGLSHIALSAENSEESDREEEEENSQGDTRADTPQQEMDDDAFFAEEAKSNRKFVDHGSRNIKSITVSSIGYESKGMVTNIILIDCWSIRCWKLQSSDNLGKSRSFDESCEIQQLDAFLPSFPEGLLTRLPVW